MNYSRKYIFTDSYVMSHLFVKKSHSNREAIDS